MSYLCADVYAHYVGMTVACTPSRALSGVAPFGLVLDMFTGTSALNVTRPLRQMMFHVDWGDGSAGTWSTNGASRNRSWSAFPSHVYETPGDYTATCTWSDGYADKTEELEIEVTDPDVVFAGALTVVVSTDGNFTGEPDSENIQVTTSDFNSVFATHGADNKRILFRTAQNFTSDGNATITATGAFRVGIFGGATKANVVASGSHDVIQIHGGCTDVAIEGLAIDGDDNATSQGIDFLTGSPANTVIWDCSFTGLNNPIHIPDTGHTGTVIGNCTGGAVVGAGANLLTAFGGSLLGIIGNTFNGTVGSSGHIVRIGDQQKYGLSDNILNGAAANLHALKLHGPNYTADNYNEQGYLSFNKYVGAAGAWTVAMGPEDDAHDQRVRDVVSMCDWFTSGSGTQIALRMFGVERVAVISPLMNGTGGAAGGYGGVNITQRGVEPEPNDNWIISPTIYRGDANTEYVAVGIGAGATNNVVKDVLAYSPLATTAVVVDDDGTNTTASNNTSNVNAKALDPLFVDSTPSALAEFALQATSPYLGDADPADPVFLDVLGNRRFYGNTAPVIDAGAVQTS